MKVAVLGAGVVGVTTAYYLAERGCQVTVFDSGPDVACGASRANGGQLSYSFVESFAQPSNISKLPHLFRGNDIGSQVRFSTGLLPWGLRYLINCAPKRARKNTLALLKMAARSAELIAEIEARAIVDLPIRTAGKLVLLGSRKDIRTAESMTESKQGLGVDARLVSASDAVAIEPALSSLETPIEAAIYSKNDRLADSHKFAAGLKEFLESERAVEFRFDVNVKNFVQRRGKVIGVQCEEIFPADAVVVCLGAWSGLLLGQVGIRPHIYPVRGYSVTLPLGNAPPSVSVTLLEHRIVLSRLDNSVRIAGFADFYGFDTGADSSRIETMVKTVRRFAPNVADYDVQDLQPWGGFRPMTPGGTPIVGPTKIDGLHLNIGHGMFGWTLACASADLAARGVCGR